MLKYVYYGITAVSIVVLGLSVKYLLGGYDEIVIEETEDINYVIAGKYIEKTWSDDQKEAWEQELSSRLSEERVKGKKVEVVFFPDSLEAASGTRFSGIAMSGNIVTIPPGYQVIDMYEPNGLKTLLRMNSIVRPSIEKLRKMMVKTAADNYQKLDDRVLLFYGQQDSLTVMVGAK